MVSNMAPSRVIGGMAQSSANSGIFFQGDGQSQNFINSHMSSSFGNSTSSIPGTVRSNLGPASGDINQTVLNSVANSASSIGASSLVTDANSAFSGGGPQLHRSASMSMDSYMRLPTSPMSFTSNNISVSGSSIIDGSSTVQQNSHHDPNSQHVNQSQQHLQQGTLSATSLPTSQNGQVTIPMASRIPNTLIQDPTYLSPAQKKPRLDIKQEDFVQQQVIQQLLQRDPMQLQSHNPQFQAFIQQQRLRQQQQILQAMPQMQRAQLHQQQLRQQLQQQNMQQMPVMKNPHESGGICARRLMQYLFHQRKPTENNTISYWRSFVKEYYAPRAKKRWCLSQYENVANQGFGVFPQATMDAWHCDICGSKSGKGFEATYEVLPRLNEIKFSSGVIDELLFLDIPHERRAASGIMMLEYAKAVQETVYEQVRIVREGHLRIIFTQDLKILSWEFCARRHEELLPRRIVASQVNQLLQVAQKCQSTANGSGSEGVSTQDLQSNSNMMVNAGRQLAKSLELQSLNDLGFSKRYVRCLQIAEVVNSMKDLMDFCRESKAGPIEGLKNYPRHTSSPSNLHLQKMQEIEQLASMQGLPTDRNTLNKLMAMQLGINNHAVNNNNPPSMAGPSVDNHASALLLSNCQSILTRQSSINSNPGSLQQDASSSHNNSHPSASPSSSFQGPSSVLTGSMQGGFPSPGVGPQQQQQQRAMCANVGLLQNQHPRGNQTLQQQMIQQLLHDMSNNNRAAGTPPGQQGQQQRSIAGQHGLGGFSNNSMSPMVSVPSGVGSPASSSGGGMGGSGPTLNKCSSFKTTSNSDSSAAVGTSCGFNPKVSASATQAADMSQNLHLADEMVQELTNDFTDNGYFSSNLDDALGYGWKA